MSTETLSPDVLPATGPRRVPRRSPEPIPFGRVLLVELQKMFDTRAGFWLMASIVIASVIATVVTVLLGDRDALSFDSFAAAVGSPMSILLPVAGVLAVTSEWSQRTALTTFTLVPSRPRVIGAKVIDVLAIGVVSMVLALGIGALGNVVTSLVTGNDAIWDISATSFAKIILANELGMLLGGAGGRLGRRSPAPGGGDRGVNILLPGISGALASSQQWWADHAGWFDLNQTRFLLFDSNLTGEQWTQLGVTTLIWIVVPFLVGLRLVLKTEIK